MFTDNQIDLIVGKINGNVDLPILGEKGEAHLLKFAVKKIIPVLEKELPEDILSLVHNTGVVIVEGLEGMESVKDCLVKFLNNKVNIPIIGEKTEGILIKMVVDLLFDFIKEGNSFFKKERR